MKIRMFIETPLGTTEETFEISDKEIKEAEELPGHSIEDYINTKVEVMFWNSVNYGWSEIKND